MLKEGIKGTQEVVVSEENTAKTMGSGALDVFATPAMIALMENAACNAIADGLEERTALSGRRKRNRRNSYECKTCSGISGRNENYM